MPSVAASFLALKNNLEPTPTLAGIVEQRHNAVRSVIERILPSAETKLIGSHQRWTRIHPRPGDKFDIDILLILGEVNTWNPNGATVEQAFQVRDNILQESPRYGQMDQVRDDPSVMIEYADNINVEIVVAYRDNIGCDVQGRSCAPVGRGFWVAKPEGWSYADYDHDATQLSAHNAVMDGNLVPLIKMLKALRREHFADRITAYHLEIFATRIMPVVYVQRKNLGYPTSYPHLIREFFANAMPWIGQNVQFPGSNALPLSVPLLHRPALTGTFNALRSHADNALRQLSEGDQVRIWQQAFGTLLPLR